MSSSDARDVIFVTTGSEVWVFQVQTDPSSGNRGRKYRFRCESDKQCEQWLSTFKLAREQDAEKNRLSAWQRATTFSRKLHDSHWFQVTVICLPSSAFFARLLSCPSCCPTPLGKLPVHHTPAGNHLSCAHSPCLSTLVASDGADRRCHGCIQHCHDVTIVCILAACCSAPVRVSCSRRALSSCETDLLPSRALF